MNKKNQSSSIKINKTAILRCKIKILICVRAPRVIDKEFQEFEEKIILFFKI